MIFEPPHLFGILDYRILSYLVALRLDLAAQNLQTSVLGLTSNVSKNWHSGFIALGFYTVTDWLGDIGLLSENLSGLEAIADSIIFL